jgi:hypothetical protein
MATELLRVDPYVTAAHHLRWLTDFAQRDLSAPAAEKKATGENTARMTVRRLRSSLRISSLSTVMLKPPNRRDRREAAPGAGSDGAFIVIEVDRRP